MLDGNSSLNLASFYFLPWDSSACREQLSFQPFHIRKISSLWLVLAGFVGTKWVTPVG